MNHKRLLSALLLSALLCLNACSKKPNEPVLSDTDTDTTPPAVTETAPQTPAPPVVMEPQTEAPSEETTVPPVEIEPEPTPETETPLPDLPIELPQEDTPAETPDSETSAETAETEEKEPTPPAPIVIAKPTIDLSGQLVPGGAPVTGQTMSAQSEHIRLLLDYTIVQSEDGTTTLDLNVGLSCYELWCSAKTDMGTITVNGVSRTFSTDAIDHMTREKTYIPFFTQTYNATGSQSASVEVSWVFNGNYGGVDIGTLTTGVILKYDSAVDAPAEIVPAEPSTEGPVDEVVTEGPVDPAVPAEPTDPVPPAEPADPVTPATPVAPPMEPDPSADAPADIGSQPTDGENPVVEVAPPPPEEAGTP